MYYTDKMKKLLTILLLLISASAFSQADTLNPYRGAYTDMKSPYHFKKATKYDSMIWARKARFEDSVAFRGKTYVPMAPNGDSSNLVASTKWVKQNITGGGGGYDYSGKLDSVRRLSDLTVVEYSGSPSAVIGNPIYKDSVGVTALFRSVGTDSIYAVINGLPVYQFKDSSGSSGSDSTAYVNGLVVNDSTLRLYRFNGDSSDFVIKGNGIPITGTNPASGPVKGDIEIDASSNRKIYAGTAQLLFDDELSVKLKNGNGDDDITVNVGSSQVDLIATNSTSGFTSTISVTPVLMGISSTDPASRGFAGDQDFTANITDLDYTQKKYVDSVAGTTYDSTIVATAGQEDFIFTSVPSDYSKYRIFINGCEIEPVTYFTTLLNTISFIGPLQEGDRVRYWRIK